MITCLGLSPALDVTYGVGALEPGGIHRPEWKLALPGGKSLNVARALRALGVPVRAIAPLGGAVGAEMRTALEAEGLDLVVVPTAAPTRMCVSVVDDATERITEIYERAPELDDAAWVGVTGAISRIGSGWLAVSGAVPSSRARELGDELAAARDRGIRLAVDLRGAALHAVLAATAVDVVKVNRAEAEEAVGAGEAAGAGGAVGAGEPVGLARRLRDAGARIAVVTDGAAGSTAASAHGTWRASAPRAGRFTVGAGDSFLAGLLLALDRGDELPDALRTASAVAAASTLQPGAAILDAGRIASLAAGIRIDRLDRLDRAEAPHAR